MRQISWNTWQILIIVIHLPLARRTHQYTAADVSNFNVKRTYRELLLSMYTISMYNCTLYALSKHLCCFIDYSGRILNLLHNQIARFPPINFVVQLATIPRLSCQITKFNSWLSRYHTLLVYINWFLGIDFCTFKKAID